MEFVEQLKSSIDIVKVVGDYVRLKRIGATGRYTGLCPFHQEKTPSFSVNQSRQFYKCFGCGVGGDAIKFVMEVDGLSFPEALAFLAERNGVPMPKRNEYSDSDSKLRAALMDMHSIAARQFQANLRGPQGAEARAYLEGRGLSQELIDTFELGYSDSSGQGLVRRFGEQTFSPEQIEASGLVRKRTEGSGYYDVFRGRLMFPIHNESGKVIAFGGRAMQEGESAKYVNSSETPIYRKSSVLYNLHRARSGMRNGRAVLVEGYMDVIGVYAAGIKEVVASCGTALTNAQVRIIHRHTDSVVLNFDPDSAGAKAAEGAIQLFLDEGLQVRVVALEGGLDPDDYVKQHGADAYRAKVEGASSYFHWLADRAREKFDMRSSEGRMAAFKFLMPAVQKAPDKLERAAIASDLAGYLGVDPGLVLEQFKKAAAERTAPGPARIAQVEVPALERILLDAMLASEQARSEILPILPAAVTQNFVTSELFEGLRQTISGGAGFTFASLEGRLSSAGQALLHNAVSADDTGDEEVLLEQARACVQRLKTDRRKRELDELRGRIKAAEREGRVSEALSLMAELRGLETDAGD